MKGRRAGEAVTDETFIELRRLIARHFPDSPSFMSKSQIVTPPPFPPLHLSPSAVPVCRSTMPSSLRWPSRACAPSLGPCRPTLWMSAWRGRWRSRRRWTPRATLTPGPSTRPSERPQGFNLVALWERPLAPIK